jgi:Fur family ferric uptake transcriptional regulator/Fur family peroxide stress response transcriptional regulator
MTVPTDVRLTPQRRAVLDVLRATDDHPTAAEVYERVRVMSPGIGAATVYRSLALLVRTGQALELSLDEGAARYDARVDRHDHLLCERCDRAVDVDSPVPARMVAQVAAETGFRVFSYDLRFRGLCPACTGETAAETPRGPSAGAAFAPASTSPHVNPGSIHSERQ